MTNLKKGNIIVCVSNKKGYDYARNIIINERYVLEIDESPMSVFFTILNDTGEISFFIKSYSFRRKVIVYK